MKLLWVIAVSLSFSIGQAQDWGTSYPTIQNPAPSNSGSQNSNGNYGMTTNYQYQPAQRSAEMNADGTFRCPAGYSRSFSTAAGMCDLDESNGDRAIATDPRTGLNVALPDDCDAERKKTEKMCKGAEFSQYGSVAMGLATTFAQMKSQGNIKGACEAAQKINSLGAVSNAAVAGMCAKAVSKCKDVCGEDNSKFCSEFDQYAKLATMQAVQNATGYVGSSACANAVAGKCTGDEASNDEECVQFCMKPGRQDHPKCKIALNSCGSPTFATANVQYCTCLSNPFAANCSTLTGADPIPGTGTVPTPPDFSADGLANSEYDMNANKLDPTQARVNGQSGGSAGFDGGGGGSSAFGANNGSGSGDDPLSKDILTGTGSGGAVGAAYGGGGYNENGSGGKNGKGSASTDSNGIDLRAFLPGGKKDPNRNPASAGYIDPTITKANGLTNFQKVTRKMNEKRPELMP